jgi:hypothetical protein
METKVIDVQPAEIQKVGEQSLAVQNTSPIMQLADKLAEGKITAEQMQIMLDVQIKWEKNEAEKAYHVAMAKFQEDAPAIIKTKDGHNCKYAGLSDIVAAVAPKLSAQGLSHAWITDTGESGIKVTCKITHEKGHSEETALAAGPDGSGNKNAIQAIGSTVTYLQRYTLKAALGLAEGDQGDDGQGAGKTGLDIPFPTDLEWESVDAIIVALKDPTIDREKLAKWFLADCGKYPCTKAKVNEAAEYVMQKNPPNIYTKC